ncbi:MAG: type II toxin-antitoxin system Phd/YefM family antitoxin [Betaproteobacteria bacterium]|nr:type II toxin-antitoxin system Phd/YefM family antitoxin [Betaproteobacteria bacterium]
MKKATISKTKNQLSALLEEVRRGETVLIMDRDRPVAMLEPVRPDAAGVSGWIAELERRGVIRRARRKPPRRILAERPPRAKGGASVLEALLEERAEGR